MQGVMFVMMLDTRILITIGCILAALRAVVDADAMALNILDDIPIAEHKTEP